MRLPNVITRTCSRTAFVIAVLLVLLACAIHAAEQRTWTDNTGKFSVEAELVEVKDGQAVLKKSDGKTVAVPVSRLSAADQEFVQKQAQTAAAWPVSSATAPVDTTGLNNLTLPNAMTEPPDWLANDPTVPFDVKDFFAVPPPEENAAPIYLLAFSHLEHPLYLHIHGIDEKKERGKAREIYEAQKGPRDAWYSIVDQYAKFESNPPTAEEPSLEALDKVIDTYRPWLDLIQQAQQRPQCVFQPGYSFFSLIWHASASRDVTRRLDLVLRAAIRRGQPDEAIETVRATLRMSRDLRPRGPSTIQSVATSIEGSVYGPGPNWIYRILAAPGLTVAHCDQLLAILREHRQRRINGFAEACKSGYIMSRLFVRDFQTGTWRDVLQEIGLSGPRTQAAYLSLLLEIGIPDSLTLLKQHPILRKLTEGNKEEQTAAITQFAEKFLTMTDDNYAEEVKAINECYAALLALKEKTYLERLPMLDAASQPLINTSIAVFLPPQPGKSFCESAMRNDALFAGAECLVAMRRWQLDKGSPPADLKTALQAAGIAEIPLDPFTDKPLRTTTIDGKLVVYSIGPDGQDDGARERAFTRKPPGQDPNKGDLVFELP